jgi:hypothetical protein
MSRYVGLLMLVLTALLAVNFASDVLYERAVAAQVDEAEQADVAAAGTSERLPLTGLIRIPTGHWDQARILETSATRALQTAQVHDGKALVASH